MQREVQTRPQGCPIAGYVGFDGVCYKSFTETRTLDEARQTCAADGGIIAMPKDSATNTFLANLGEVAWGRWLGLTDHGGQWAFEDGQTLTSSRYSNWLPGEPQQDNGNGGCVGFWKGGSFWDEKDCSYLRGFICQQGNLSASILQLQAYERATCGLRESNFTIFTCNCCTDSARSTCVPRRVLASSVLTPYFPVDLLNDHAEHTCTIPDDLTGDCQLVSKMPRKAQKKTTRQDPKKRAAEDTRAASDDEVNRRCTHLQRASTACTRQRGKRTEVVRCKHVQLTYHLRNVLCTQPLTVRRVVQTTYVHLAQQCG
ncbi:hypothetical protein Bbelb_314010 [Branchiostoma belcheri]|nr:hypothetical protein Bbelb_314010 [Branchiostoma belcheri]